jgi:methylmalonyl-CoA mutase
MAKNENPNQGSYFLSQLTDLVEEAVLGEFDRISSRGGVLGAMETQYQRGKIQEESLYYETLKHSGELPIIGVNTYLNPRQDELSANLNIELARASYEEKDARLKSIDAWKQENSSRSEKALESLKAVALSNGNVFEELLKTTRVATLGQMTQALYAVGGQYRRAL